jgi:alanyl-tRNA synthetase
VSGKHNDLEEVGVDTYHHTFFEMLGNWSFGDYFKREAIRWGWAFLTNWMGLPGDKLWATVFGGEEKLGLEPDTEAEAFWPAESGIPAERVLRFGVKDNFWEMAETGPCGPCSEIHMDLGPEACDRKGVEGHKCKVNGDCARYIEIWNLVFIQYNRLDAANLKPLPAKHVDTGMGFERLAAVCQGHSSNYDTDLFTPMLDRIGELTGSRYGQQPRADVAMRVISDHVRALSVAIADGALPGNKDRGYVLRRLLRRASRFGYQVLGEEHPFIFKLVPIVADVFSGVFPEISQRVDHIGRVVESEELAFLRTLERGITRFDGLTAALAKQAAAGGKGKAKVEADAEVDVIDGAEAFDLYST